MTSSFCLSYPRNIITPAFLIHNSHLHLSKHRSLVFSQETQIPKRDPLILKPYSPLSKPSLSLLRLKNYKLQPPFAALSSFAEGDDIGKLQATEHQENEKLPEEEENGMAQAFNISSNTATAISMCIALAALTFPFFMYSLGQGMTLETKFLSYATLLFGFYMAWNIGANDVANAMGTSVGSGALTLRQAVLTAAVLEFSGALLMGTHVTSTMQKGILVANVFQGKDTLLFAGLLPSLAAAGTWLQFVYSAPNPGQAAAPIAVFVGVTGISFAAFPLSNILPIALAQALACGTVSAVLFDRIIRKQLGHLLVKSSSTQPEQKGDAIHQKNIGFLAQVAGPTGTQLEMVYKVFGYMPVLSACFMSFAHGGNDVSNAIGPLAGALSILQGGMSAAEIVIPTDVLAWGGFGIVAGLTMWGYRVIATIGKKITELTPTRGFAAEFAAASVVLFASKLALPISATHTLVGAVMGVGFARGLNSVGAETVREIVTSWVVTIPVGAFFAILYTWILTRLLSYVL